MALVPTKIPDGQYSQLLFPNVTPVKFPTALIPRTKTTDCPIRLSGYLTPLEFPTAIISTKKLSTVPVPYINNCFRIPNSPNIPWNPFWYLFPLKFLTVPFPYAPPLIFLMQLIAPYIFHCPISLLTPLESPVALIPTRVRLPPFPYVTPLEIYFPTALMINSKYIPDCPFPPTQHH